MNRRKTGKSYERIAENYLLEQGIKVLERNYGTSQGEIDLIVEDWKYVIFIEVKYRKDDSYGQPWEAVSKKKQQKICRVARQFCYTRKIKKQIRYDVISICGEEIYWFQNAFFHIEN